MKNIKLFPNFGLPTYEQWQNVVTAFTFAFISTFLGVLVAAGGIQSTTTATFALIGAALVAGINAGLYAVYITFFKKSE